MNENLLGSENTPIRLDGRKMLRWILLCGCLLLAAVAMMVEPTKLNTQKYWDAGLDRFFTLLRSEMGKVGLSQVLALAALLVLFQRILWRKNQPFSLSALITGGILSGFLLMGDSFSAFHNFAFIFNSSGQFCIAVIVGAGYWVILYSLLKLLFGWMDRLRLREHRYAGVLAWIDRHFFAVSILTILISWAVLALPYFPGSIPHDGRNQLNMYYGYQELYVSHPYYSTMIMGLIYDLGYQLFGTTGGCLFYVGFQGLICGAVFARICDYIHRKMGRLLPGVCTLLFFAVSPIWWTYIQAVMKDSLYVGLFALFMLEAVKIFLKDGRWWNYGILGVSGVLACCMRKGFAYVVFAAMVALLLAVKERRKLLCLVCGLSLIGNYVANTWVIQSLELETVNQVEALSIPLQQIARYVTEHEEELTKEEQKIIDHVVRYSGIPERYNPEISDPIKNHYRNTTPEQWDDFWQLWLDKFKDDPKVYIVAALNHVFGYTDPFYFENIMQHYQLYTKDSICEGDQDVVYSEYLMDKEQRDESYAAVHLWEKTPILSFVTNPGAYTWLVIILLAALLRKGNRRSALLFTAPVILLLGCCGSPVNGLLRYALPVMAVAPLLILLAFLACRKESGSAQ